MPPIPGLPPVLPAPAGVLGVMVVFGVDPFTGVPVLVLKPVLVPAKPEPEPEPVPRLMPAPTPAPTPAPISAVPPRAVSYTHLRAHET